MVSNFDPNVPTGLVDLDTDYKNLQKNNAQLDTTFGIDHYKFSNQNINENGFHNKVTTPLIIGGVHPVTAAAIPIFYAMTETQPGSTLPIGNIQYSRGPPRALAVAPSPVTILQSLTTAITIIPGASENILDFTGLPRAMCKFYFLGDVIGNQRHAEYTVWWYGAAFSITRITGDGTPVLEDAGLGVLRLRNGGGIAVTNLYWSMQLLRVT